MRVAVFHDYFGSVGGGERVALALADVCGADIITTDTDSLAMLPSNQRILSLGRTVKSPPFKQMSAAYRFSSCDFREDYDLFIFSGNWAHHAAEKHHPNLMYCHTPVRALYDLYETFSSRLPLHKRIPFHLWASIYRRLDQAAISSVDAIIANSENTRGRINKYHRRNAEVIYPPIDTKRFACKRYGDFWLSVNRLYPEKRIELQIESFKNLPDERLIIVGGYAEGDHAGRAYAQKLFSNLPENVEIRGELSDSMLLDLYATCKGVICTAMDEDFGMTPLEAMAAGKPVVAVREGGFLESVTEGTGLLVDPIAEKISDAIAFISKEPERYRDACRARAALFDRSVFEEQVRAAAGRVIESSK